MTRQVLTTQLRELEADNVIGRREFPKITPHVEYYLTDFGRTLTPIPNLHYRWSELYPNEKPEAMLKRVYRGVSTQNPPIRYM